MLNVYLDILNCKGSKHSFMTIITVRNEYAKVMFLQASVCPRRGGVPGPGGLVLGGCLVPGGSAPGGGIGVPACTEADPPPRDGHCCGRYASYCNAFLFFFNFQKLYTVTFDRK